MSRSQRDDELPTSFDVGAAAPGRLPPPPPSAALAAALAGMRPVRTRSRFGALAAVALAGAIWPALTLMRHTYRRDLAALPPAWVVAAVALWAVAAAAALAAALVPRRGDVLPAPARASRVGATALVALLAFAVLGTVQVPGVSLRPEDVHWTLLHSCLHCAGFVLGVAAPVLAVGVLALRRLVPVGGARIGVALGAAGGALGGLVLCFICPFAEAAHVALGHVGGAALAAAAGALLLPALVRR